ncbi:MAG: hypothetical protein N4A41_00475 [Crocinitomicaceae bacterium]|jgi:hypothetical protein|nr:hypothetical protein [Crocinitomicaceae bacterium]
MTKYKLHIIKPNADFEITYKNGHFHSLKKMRGKVNQQTHEYLMKLSPQLELGLEIIKRDYQHRVQIELIQDTTKPYDAMLQEYTEWFEAKFKFKPRINPTEIKNIKAIQAYLKSIDSNSEVVWKQILSNWNHLPDFYQRKVELRHIYSNLNLILTHIKQSHAQPSSKYSRK